LRAHGDVLTGENGSGHQFGHVRMVDDASSLVE
jgi:hypothetical protein